MNFMSTATNVLSSDADRDVERRVISYLVGRHVPGLRQISVHAHCGVVTLRGRVHSFYEKQLGQQVAQRVAGVVRLVDRIEVTPALNPVAVLGA
jgi:osmotically-inducible protein OsmY